MRTAVLSGVLALSLAGCAREVGNGAWNLNLGGEARLVSPDGSEITLENLVAPAPGKAGRRSTRAAKAEVVTLPAGTTVQVLAIDGDDARIRIKDGANTGSIYWVPCAQLEAISK